MKKIFYFLCLFLISSIANAQMDLHNGLIARFRFNGNANDSSPNHYDGTLHGNATANAVLKLGDNTNDYVQLPPEIMNGLGDFSVAFTIEFNKLHTTGSFPTNHYLTGSSGFSLDRIGFSYEKALNSWRAAINGQTNSFPDATVAERTVYCVCIMRSGSTSKIYVNENLLGSFTTNTTLLPITSLLIGQEEDCSGGCFAQNQCMNGGMNGLMFWNRALNEDEVNELCHQANGGLRLENESAGDIAIAPNPVTDNFEVSGPSVSRIQIYDLSGRLIYTQLNSNHVNTQSIPPGIYIADVIESDGNSTRIRFVKE